jgi:hypothetical protein
MINWKKAKKKDYEKVEKILDRIERDCHESIDRTDMSMDLIAVHISDMHLDFHKLLNFNDFSFYHDIKGIKNNINRYTGKLDNCFVPRCAA